MLISFIILFSQLENPGLFCERGQSSWVYTGELVQFSRRVEAAAGSMLFINAHQLNADQSEKKYIYCWLLPLVKLSWQKTKSLHFNQLKTWNFLFFSGQCFMYVDVFAMEWKGACSLHLFSAFLVMFQTVQTTQTVFCCDLMYPVNHRSNARPVVTWHMDPACS